MRRRDFLFAAAPRVDYRDYSRILPAYLTRLASQAYERRNRAIAAITTPEAVKQRQRWVRETFWKLAGGPLRNTRLSPRVAGGFERPGYRVEHVLYQSRPELFIPANLYIPKQGQPPYPGVLFQMGHSLNGKAAALYQYCCQGLAQLGFVVLAFDPMGQGERTYYPREGGTLTRLSSADEEHTLPGKQMLLVGDTSTRFQVWDAIRSLDYLASHPLVDPKRLASTGNSGGGTLTMLLIAADDRLACAAVSCGNTENHACADFNPPGSTDDAEQDFINGGPVGFDRWDTLYPMAPKPLLFVLSGKDAQGTYSPRYLANGREEFAKLQRIYGILGKANDIDWVESPLPHGISYDARMSIYAWFRRHLQGITEPLAEEPPVAAEKEETLWVTKSGNVVRDLSSATPLSQVRRQAAAIETPAKLPDLEKFLSLDKLVGSMRSIGSTRSRLVRIDAVEIESAPQVWLPGWIFQPMQGQDRRLLLVVEPGGRNARWNEDSLYQQMAAAGHRVCAIDVRGLGDMRPEFPRGAPGHGRSHQEEEAYAWASLMLGKPLLGQRVTDIVAAVRALSAQHEIALAASGSMVAPALFATALEPKVTSLTIMGGLESYRALLESEQLREPLANFVFDMLRNVDAPQLIEAIKPREVRRVDAWTQAALWPR
ncbi:MAG: prolyl oligopeptidase family serine peptidase [Bryobacteraceae bacterium]